MSGKLGTGIGVALIAVLAVGIPAAQADHSVSGNVGCGNDECVEIWNLKCNSDKTKCASAVVCDNTADGGDVMAASILAYSPTGLIGKGEIWPSSGVAGSCTVFIDVCRGGTSKGPIKALIHVSVPSDTGGAAYWMDVHCRDKNGASLPSSTHTVTRATDQ
jgi:hypothetical protein